MISGNHVRKGLAIMYNDTPYLVLDHKIQKFGRGGSYNKVKLKNILNGSIIPVTYASDDKIEEADVQKSTVQFIYNDGNECVFMNPETFEQVTLDLETIPGGLDYLKSEEKYIALFYQDEVISIELPKKIRLQVTQSAPGVKGDSANNPQKEVTLETGAKIMVPLFIKEGDFIDVNTDDNSYTGKSN